VTSEVFYRKCTSDKAGSRLNLLCWATQRAVIPRRAGLPPRRTTAMRLWRRT